MTLSLIIYRIILGMTERSIPNHKDLERLAKQIKHDQSKISSAEKRVKIKSSFTKAVKQIAQPPPPEKEAK
jgi:hypothetical protein